MSMAKYSTTLLEHQLMAADKHRTRGMSSTDAQAKAAKEVRVHHAILSLAEAQMDFKMHAWQREQEPLVESSSMRLGDQVQHLVDTFQTEFKHAFEDTGSLRQSWKKSMQAVREVCRSKGFSYEAVAKCDTALMKSDFLQSYEREVTNSPDLFRQYQQEGGK